MANHRDVPAERQHHPAEEIGKIRPLRRALLLAPLAVVLSAGRPLAQQPQRPPQRPQQQQQRQPNAQTHWLIGQWEGDMVGLPPLGPGGSRRILRVNAVAPNGASGRGVLIVNDNKQNVALKIDGDNVTFATPGSNGVMHDLVRRGNALEGSWLIRGIGRSGTLRLERKQ